MPTKFTVEHTCSHCHEIFDVQYRRSETTHPYGTEEVTQRLTFPVSATSCPSCGNIDTHSSEEL